MPGINRAEVELRAVQQSKALPPKWGADKALGRDLPREIPRESLFGEQGLVGLAAATAAAPEGSKGIKDPSIPNSCKACSAALGFFSSRRFLANTPRQERRVEARVGSGWVGDCFSWFSWGVERNPSFSMTWELWECSGVVLELWSSLNPSTEAQELEGAP